MIWHTFSLLLVMRPLSEKDLALVMSMGMLHYSVQQVADNLDDVREDEVRKAMFNPESEIAIAYRKGKSRAQMKLDMKLYEMAQGGDLEALKKLEIRQRENEQADKTDPKNAPYLFGPGGKFGH